MAYITEALEKGQVVAMDIDIQGARQVKEKMPEAVFVFLLPPTMAELESRLRGRSSDSDIAIRQRLDTALSELKAGIEYDYVIRNDEIDRAADQLVAIITAERCRLRHSEYFELLKDIVGEQGVISKDDEPTAH